MSERVWTNRIPSAAIVVLNHEGSSRRVPVLSRADHRVPVKWRHAARRKTEIPAAAPVGLSTAFATEPIKQTEWKGFWRKVVRTEPTPDFEEVVKSAGRFLLPAAEVARVGSGSPGHWTKGGPWGEP